MGEFYALAAAVAWAFAVILFKKSGETLSPFTLNFLRVSISSALFLTTLLLLGQPVFPDYPVWDYLILAASGLIAIALSDTLFHKSLNMVGAGISAIVDSFYSPFVVLFAFVLLEERLGLWQYAGMLLVLFGVLIAAKHRPPPGVPRRQIVMGVLWGLAAMTTLALGIVIAKPVLERSTVIWATAIRQWASLIVMVPLALRKVNRDRIRKAFAPGGGWRTSLSGTILGSYVALLCWIAGMKYTEAGAAAILNQTSTIYILVFASIFLGEAFTRRKLVASALAVCGILLVTLGKP